MSSINATPSSVTPLIPLPLKPRARGWIHLVATPIVLCAVMVAIAFPEFWSALECCCVWCHLGHPVRRLGGATTEAIGPQR